MEASVSRKWKTIDMAYIALFAVLMAVCSWISIPAVVPFTLQTFGVFVAVSVLGGKRGTLAVVLYLLMASSDCQYLRASPGGWAFFWEAPADISSDLCSPRWSCGS